MGNNKEESARREGMAYALRIAKEKGIEALEKELEFRNITNIPIKISKGQVEAFYTSCLFLSGLLTAKFQLPATDY